MNRFVHSRIQFFSEFFRILHILYVTGVYHRFNRITASKDQTTKHSYNTFISYFIGWHFRPIKEVGIVKEGGRTRRAKAGGPRMLSGPVQAVGAH